MFLEIIRKINARFLSHNAETMVAEIHKHDRWSSFDKYHLSSKYCRQKLAEYGLKETEVIKIPADGKTTYGDWIMPLAWDAKGGTLSASSHGSAPGDAPG